MTEPMSRSQGRFVALRLKPGAEVMAALRDLVVGERIAAAAVVAAVGSLTEAAIRYANQPGTTLLRGHFEVCALSGTLECAPSEGGPGGGHLHLAISDGAGRMIGGHMMEGCRVYTTLEIVLLVLEDFGFTREPCALSGHPELVIRPAMGGPTATNHRDNRERS